MSSGKSDFRIALIVLGLFGIIHGLVSFPNHALFRTYALDLGLYTHAMWHYVHGSVHDSSLFMEHPQPILADHFDLYLPAFSPLIYLFGSWTLLIVQWSSILIGAWGVRQLLIAIGSSASGALLGMALFLLNFGLFAAMAFDYHSNVVAAMVLPWFILMLIRERMVAGCLLFLMMLVSKENMGFWIGTVALVLATMSIIPKRARNMCLVLGPLGLLWSVGVIGWVMPSLSNGNTYAHFDYGILGGRLSEVPATILRQPMVLLKALFMDHRNMPQGTEVKLEFWWMMLVSGGWALIARPKWGLMALPLIAQKMWHNDLDKWSVVAHYGVEFVPLIAIAVPLALAHIANSRTHRVLPWVAIVLTLITTIRFMDHTVAYQDRSRIRIYQSIHYTKPYSIEALRQAMRLIPDDAVVSAQSPVVPHLALRDHLYQYPMINDAAFVILTPIESPYPLDSTAYRVQKERLLADPEWTAIQRSDAVILFHRMPNRQ